MDIHRWLTGVQVQHDGQMQPWYRRLAMLMLNHDAKPLLAPGLNAGALTQPGGPVLAAFNALPIEHIPALLCA